MEIIDKKIIVEDMINNNLSILEVSKKYDCSVSTIRKYLAKLSNSDDHENLKLYESYKEYSNKKLADGRKKGAEKGKRKPFLSEEEINNLAVEFVNGEHSLRSLANFYKIPKSTLHEWFSSYLTPENRKKVMDLYNDNETVNKKKKQGGFNDG